MVAECRRLYGDNYTQRPDGGTNDCDEYPFASTYQSANYDTIGTAATWAVMPVLSTHNQSAGSILGNWYRSDHLLDGDNFYVSIINAPTE